MLRSTETRVVYENIKEFLQPWSNRKKICRSSEEERVENIHEAVQCHGRNVEQSKLSWVILSTCLRPVWLSVSGDPSYFVISAGRTMLSPIFELNLLVHSIPLFISDSVAYRTACI